MPEDKLIDLYSKKYLRFYIVKIMLNIIKSPTKKFFLKFKNYDPLNNYEKADTEYNETEIKVSLFVDELHWYKQEILRLYTFEFNKNAKELSNYTNIPYMSIIRTLNQVKQELKKKIRK